MDFANPTPEQIADAKKHGIDLRDPLVVKELQRIQQEGDDWDEGEEGEEAEEGDEDEDEEDDGANGGDGGGVRRRAAGSGGGSGARDEVPSMYRGKMASRLQRMKQGGGSGEIDGRRAAQRRSAGYDAAHPQDTSKRTQYVIFAVALLVGVYRAWGVLSSMPSARQPATRPVSRRCTRPRQWRLRWTRCATAPCR